VGFYFTGVAVNIFEHFVLAPRFPNICVKGFEEAVVVVVVVVVAVAVVPAGVPEILNLANKDSVSAARGAVPFFTRRPFLHVGPHSPGQFIQHPLFFILCMINHMENKNTITNTRGITRIPPLTVSPTR
jgi:hypothetical protein